MVNRGEEKVRAHMNVVPRLFCLDFHRGLLKKYRYSRSPVPYAHHSLFLDRDHLQSNLEIICGPRIQGRIQGGVDRVDIHPPFFSKKKFEMSLYLK